MSEKIFGLHAVEALLARRATQILKLCCQQGRDDERLTKLLQLAKQKQVMTESLPRKQLDQMVHEQRHQGVVAICKPLPQYHEKDLTQLLEASDKPFILILDGVTDPHNLGACLRSADAAGVDVVIAPKDKAVGLNATVRKVASGAAESVPFIQVTNLARTLKQLQEAGVWLYGLAGEAEQDLYATDLRGPCALLMGAEGKGLRRLTREHCDFLVKLPMMGHVSSLNVSVATGVSLFEVVRQRQQEMHT